MAVLLHLQRQLKSTSSEGSRSDESEAEPAPHVVTRGQSRREAVLPPVPPVPQTPPREASTEGEWGSRNAAALGGYADSILGTEELESSHCDQARHKLA